ncbi:MAG: response regulator, partial [Planctomycetales bacterium]|nr:response regulator [Planctomycetales bacterium]
AHALRTCGYDVHVAANGDEALSLVESQDLSFDLLITDVVMPGAGGRQLATEMARRLPELRILYVSGYAGDAIVDQGVRQSEVEFLQKPFTPQSLAKKARAVLDRRAEPRSD